MTASNKSDNNNNTSNKRHQRTGNSSSLWSDHILFGNLFPHTMEVQVDAVETVTKTFQETNRRCLNDAAVQKGQQQLHCLSPFGNKPTTTTTTTLPSIKKTPRVDNRARKHTPPTPWRTPGRCPFTSTDSRNSDLTSGSIPPVEISFTVDHHDLPPMALSQEKEMMKRLMQAATKEEKTSQATNNFVVNEELSTSYRGDNSVSGMTNENLSDEYSTERKYISRFINDLKKERDSLKELWKKEFEEEHKQQRSLQASVKESFSSICNLNPMYRILSYLEVYLSNMPITIGAVGLSWVTQGTIWFKFMEETIDACQPTFFHSQQCNYPEFPGCFECDTNHPAYLAAITFHNFCHCVALTCCLLFFAKCILAWQVVADELSNPATATPIGVVCITLICVAAGRFGAIGEWTVLITSAFHVLISFWFIYMAVFVFRLQPDPSWFPCTVGVAYAAVKTWLYYTIPGFLVMILCIIYFFSTFFIAIYRAAVNHKITAPVCFIGLSAPSITMYAMTIMGQPSSERISEMIEAPDLRNRWNDIHRGMYLPVMHFMMFLSLVGFAASLQCLWTRWPTFKKKAFSPAHFAFIFPMLSHTNAVQAYRSSVIAYSNMAVGSPYKIVLFNYWLVCLVIGTTLNIVFTYKYVRRLPEWTKVHEVLDPLEDAPPEPDDTEVHSLWWSKDNNYERLKQPFTSPAVLQANEAGALVRLRRGTEGYRDHGPYIRTRHVTAYGFDLVMTDDELRQERAELLDWVAKNKARPRHRTLSIPPFFKLQPARGYDYGSISWVEDFNRDSHRRTQTLGANLSLPV